MADWPKIKAEYIRDESASYRGLAEKYGLCRSTVAKYGKNDGWAEARRQKHAKSVSRMVDACATKEAEKAIKITDIADALIDKLNKSLEDVEPGDYDKLYMAAQILYRLKETKKGLSAADAREQEARIKKLEKEAVAESAEDKEFVFRIEGMGPEDVEGIVG